MIGFQIKRTLLIGVKSLWLHRLRSFLTVLGMVLGVCSVIIMLAIGEGASFDAQQQMRQLGSTNVIVRSVKPAESASTRRQPQVAHYGLTYDDVERIANTLPNIRVTVPMRRIPRDAWNGARKTQAVVLGTVPWLPQIMNRSVAQGRFLSSVDVHYARNVCVLEPDLARELFPFGNAIGGNVRVGLNYYRVVGVMEALSPIRGGRDASVRSDGGNGLYLPLSTVRTHFGEVIITTTAGAQQRERVDIHEIVVAVPTLDEVLETAAILRQMLARFHEQTDYEMIVPLERMIIAQRLKRNSEILLGCIAAISLLVGGIGIMNIMLASVTERTREIGIRRALGAKRRHIILQFLTETVLLSGFGGVVGVALGVTAPPIIGYFATMTTIVVWWSPALAFGISVLTGIIFGIYPARRAAYMDPIEALRHE